MLTREIWRCRNYYVSTYGLWWDFILSILTKYAALVGKEAAEIGETPSLSVWICLR
ncbi:MAG: hypothetical protein V8S95_04325 [Odoribacter sp.]